MLMTARDEETGQSMSDQQVRDGYLRLADEMNGFGERCRTAGIRFGYHNHDFELERFDDTVPLDVLLENTDPELVTFEVDFFWLVHGGAEPLDYIARYPGRFELCHVKDRSMDGQMVDVGDGVIDFATVIPAGEAAGVRHVFVEHDRPDDSLMSVARSYRTLAQLQAGGR